MTAVEEPDVKDCVIVGGGPAGLTAALYLARFLRSVTVIDAADGRARMIPTTHNLGPFPDGISGIDLLNRMQAHAELYGAMIEPGTVISVKKQSDVFLIATSRRIETARRVIFACGVFNHRPPLPERVHDQGLVRGLIRYCPVCDAHEVRGKRIAVLGSGTHGLEEARFIRRYSASVTLIPPDGSAAPSEDGIRGLRGPIKSMSLSYSEVIITLQNGETSRFDAIYVALGTAPRTAIAHGLGILLDDNAHVIVDARQRTNVDGVYAIGDLTEGLDQIAVAMGQGAVAATAIHNELPDQSVGDA